MTLSLEDIDDRVRACGWDRIGSLVGNSSVPFLARHRVCGTEHEVRLGALEQAKSTVSKGCRICATKSRHLPEKDVDLCLKNGGWQRTGPIRRADESFLAIHLACQTERAVYLHNLKVSIKRGDTGCSNCAPHGTQLLPEELTHRFARLGWSVLETPKIVTQSVLAEHSCGEKAHVKLVNAEHAKHGGCKRCENNKRSLPVESFEAFLAAWGWKASGPCRTHDILSYVHLACGKAHQTSFNDIQTAHRRGRDGCPTCTTSGFDVTREGYVYIVEFPHQNALKIGITHNIEQRLAFHALSNDLVVHVVEGPHLGMVIRDAEQAMLARWRTGGHPPVYALKGIEGWTETVGSDEVSVSKALAMLRQLLPVGEDLHLNALRCGTVDSRIARDFVALHHYTHTCPSSMFYMGLWAEDVLMGVATFGRPSYGGVAKSCWGRDGKSGATLELRRFVLGPGLPQNTATWFLSRAMRLLPKEVEMVVSFADPNVGHGGGTYRAANFVDLGMTEPSYHYEDTLGNYIHKRTPWNQAKRSGVSEKDMAERRGLLKVVDLPKHRFAFGRSREAKNVLVTHEDD